MNTDYARLQMVMQQVRGWNVYDEDVLAMLMELPREHFVPAGYDHETPDPDVDPR